MSSDGCLFECGHAPFQLETDLALDGYTAIAGVDEVGRGALAGPVVAAAVILKSSARELIGKVTDSKKLNLEKREALYEPILSHARSYGVGVVSAEDIDRMNILQATLLAMKRAVDALSPTPDLCLIDGNSKAPLPMKQMTIVKGDLRVFSISAASIIAKVYRDRLMMALDGEYPAYGFLQHMGYGTKKHLDALRLHGPTPLHRKSFNVAL